MAQPIADLRAYVMERVEVVDGCWIYRGVINAAGYAYVQKHRVHRLTYQWHKGPIPDGLVLDHLCRVKACVNPEHLEAVTQAENLRRARPVTTHCVRGHLWAETAFYWNGKHRRCKTCVDENVRKYRERRRAAA